GYMPDLAPVPSDLKLWEFLAFHAHTHQLGSRKQRMSRVEECLDSVNLTEKRNAWCKKLSRGQTQRLVLAKTMLHRPEILILDEPASGLDPLSRRELRHVLQGFAREGSTVLISSHILSELAEMCSSLCIMNQGEVLAAGKTAHVRRELSHAERTLSLAVIDGQEAASSLLKQHEGVRDIKLVDEKIEFQFHGSDASQAAMLSDIIALGVSVKLLEEKTSSFEDILVQVAEQNSEK
ncbi:MAG: ATP-binding cassette domain-containing protein, partial [Akkermansiaceae bacterium]